MNKVSVNKFGGLYNFDKEEYEYWFGKTKVNKCDWDAYKRKLEIAIDALEFYADKDNYEVDYGGGLEEMLSREYWKW